MKRKQISGLKTLSFLLVLACLLLLFGCSTSGKQGTVATVPSVNSSSTTTPATTKTTIPVAQTTPKTSSATQSTSVTTALNSNISLEIELPVLLETLETLIFKVKPTITTVQIPRNALWQWEFGDGTQPETKLAEYVTAGHRYTKVGAYTIKLSLIDQPSKQALATTTKGFIISDIDSIKKTNHLRLTLVLSGQTSYRQEVKQPEYNKKTFDSELYQKDPWTFEWFEEWRNGDAGRWGGDEIKFKGDYFSQTLAETGTQTTEYYVSGKIVSTAEGMRLEDYYYYKKFSNPEYKGTDKEWIYYYQLELKPISITKISGGESPKYQYRLQGYEKIYPYIEYAGYTDNFYNSKSEIQWQPMEIDYLTGSDLQIAIDTYKLTN